VSGFWPIITVETLSAQALAALLILGSYGIVRVRLRREATRAVAS
jgi:hypothetical protein